MNLRFMCFFILITMSAVTLSKQNKTYCLSVVQVFASLLMSNHLALAREIILKRQVKTFSKCNKTC